MNRVYLDHASTSPLRPVAVRAMAEWLSDPPAGVWGDPSRKHVEAMVTRERLEADRREIAELVGARPREVALCSGATEAIAAACFGASRRGPHSVSTAVEHSAVLSWAERGSLTLVGVDSCGRADPAEMAAAVRPETSIIHLQLVNHETGTLSDVAGAVETIRRVAGERVLIHVDAAAAVGHVEVDMAELGVDLLSVSAHKFGGPPGAGALVVRRGVRIEPLLTGGDQERARRAGLENSLAARGFAAAATETRENLARDAARARDLTERVISWAEGRTGVSILGDRRIRAPHLVCLAFDRVEPQPLLIGLDGSGIAVHSGSSCSSEAFEPSPVLEAIGADAHRSMRISVGWSSTDADIVALLDELPRVLDGLESLSHSHRSRSEDPASTTEAHNSRSSDS